MIDTTVVGDRCCVSPDFTTAFLARLLEVCYEYVPPPRANVFHPEKRSASWTDWMKSIGRKVLAKRKFAQRLSGDSAAGKIAEVLSHAASFQATYATLEDELSRRTLVDNLAFRCLGRNHLAPLMPITLTEFWKAHSEIDECFLKTSGTREYWQWVLNLYEWPGHEGPIRMHATSTHLACDFVMQQYRLDAGSQSVEAEPGDVVIDGGGCFGDTALYFADRVGKDGVVHSFEFVPANLSLFRENLTMNPRLAPRINIVEYALGGTSGHRFRFDDNGPATISTAELDSLGVCEAQTLSLDDFSQRLDDRKVDLIKLDIEGAELDTLRGAEQLLRRDRPKLAIAIYHQLDHLYLIQDFLDKLKLGYRFHIRHFTPSEWETILFASVP